MSNKVLSWYFPPTGGGPDDGIHNAMVEHFGGNYNYSLAREIIQNSIDAKLGTSTDPVKVVFKLLHIQKDEFLGYDQLKEILESCKKYWEDNSDTKVFLENAMKCLSSKTIPFLKISDYNTKGLSGQDDDKAGEWYNLVRSRGASSKVGGEGGSFGIGKGAPFAASDLRTVFYSTTNTKGFQVFQGIAELVSHIASDGERKRGVGSYGYRQDSVRDMNIQLHPYWRKEVGTDIYIAGYKVEANWEESLIKSILRNFWYAIYKNDLEVEVENIVINRKNIEEQLTKFFLNESFKDYIKPIGNPLQYYKAVKEGTHFEKTLPLLGKVEFWFNEIEEHMNYVAMMRKSHMIIYSKRYNYPGSFSGVFLCDNSNGNAQLRKMEPPQHDEWIPERNKEFGKKIIDEVGDFIRDCIVSMKKNKDSGILDIPDLYKYLPDDEGIDNGDGNGSQKYSGRETDEETALKLQKKEAFDTPSLITPQKVSIINKTTKGNTGDGFPLPGKGKRKNGPNKGGGSGEKKSNEIRKTLVRAFVIKMDGDSIDYRLIIRNPVNARCNIKLYAVGEEREEKVQIEDVYDSDNNRYLFSGNRIHNISLNADSLKGFSVKIKSKIKLSLKAVLNEL